MPNLFTQRYMLLICAILVTFGGCLTDPPRTDSKPMDHLIDLLTRLTAPEESERFSVMDKALNKEILIRAKDLESVLTALGKKNVSTLIYVCIKTQNRVLYHLSAPAGMALENSAGAFPNIAYYYARVDPASGIEALLRLYRSQPKERLAVCLALGEVPQKKAREFLLTEAKTIKSAGGRVVEHLSGLKNAPGGVAASDVVWFLEQKLDREEIIVLSEWDVPWTDAQLKSLWRAGTVKRHFAVQCIMGDPDEYFDSLTWMIDQYLQTGDTDTLRQLMLSDGMRSETAVRVRKLRDSTLAKIKATEHH